MTQPPHILIVDDHREIRDALAKYLERNSMRATSAADAVAMDAALKAGRFDLIVLDVMMPGMSGWEVCRAVREEPDLKHTKVLMLTGIGERLNEMTSPLYGADAFLDKPFDLDELRAQVEDLLGGGDTEA